MSYATVFYAGMLLEEINDINNSGFTLDLPDGVYIYFDRKQNPKRHRIFGMQGWYRKDLTPVLIEDIPKELRVLQLLLT
jgi:hypothetical protein